MRRVKPGRETDWIICANEGILMTGNAELEEDGELSECSRIHGAVLSGSGGEGGVADDDDGALFDENGNFIIIPAIPQSLTSPACLSRGTDARRLL